MKSDVNTGINALSNSIFVFIFILFTPIKLDYQLTLDNHVYVFADFNYVHIQSKEANHSLPL